MYCGVPSSTPAAVNVAREPSAEPAADSAAVASPKSSSFAPDLRQHDVRGLQVAMDDALAVRAVERAGDLRSRRRRAWSSGNGAPGEPIGERLALEQLHHQVVDAILVADVEQRADVRVVQARDGARFALEALAAPWITATSGGQDLDGDDAIQPRVARPIDLAHSARAENGLNLVRPEECARIQCQ